MSDVDICNDALGYIGIEPINSIDDPEPAARQCQLFLARTIREVQASYDWGFSLKVAELSAQTEPSTLPNFKYEHKIPVDYLRFSSIAALEDGGNDLLDVTFSPLTGSDLRDVRFLRARLFRETPIPAKVAGSIIHTQFTPIRLVYHSFIRDTEQMPELIRLSIVMQMAAKLVYPLTRDTELAANIRNAAKEAMFNAEQEEGLDELDQWPEQSIFEDARWQY